MKMSNEDEEDPKVSNLIKIVILKYQSFKTKFKKSCRLLDGMTFFHILRDALNATFQPTFFLISL